MEPIIGSLIISVVRMDESTAAVEVISYKFILYVLSLYVETTTYSPLVSARGDCDNVFGYLSSTSTIGDVTAAVNVGSGTQLA